MIISGNGYAPAVPGDIDVSTADAYTLVHMVRDTLQNGANPTRGNFAFHALLEKLQIEEPQLTLDPEPYERYGGSSVRFAKRSDEQEDLIPVFNPRFGYSLELQAYPRG